MSQNIFSKSLKLSIVLSIVNLFNAERLFTDAISNERGGGGGEHPWNINLCHGPGLRELTHVPIVSKQNFLSELQCEIG